jgi:hypothetical protein
MSDTYFSTQAGALIHVNEKVNRKGYEIVYPDNLWTEHVAYGKTVKYTFSLKWIKTGNMVKRHLHVSLYRMDSGSYELTYYIN